MQITMFCSFFRVFVMHLTSKQYYVHLCMQINTALPTSQASVPIENLHNFMPHVAVVPPWLSGRVTCEVSLESPATRVDCAVTTRS
jgi:hypothetical protein